MSVKIIYGTAFFGQLLEKPEEAQKYLDVLKEDGINELDTAWIYSNSEKALGAIGAPKSFVIHTKCPGFSEGCLKRESIMAAMEKSLSDLGVDSVQVYFFHSPDSACTPLEESLEAMNDLYKAGKFKQFGLSNFPATTVLEIHKICTANSYVLPTVYQGNYNPAARHIEKDLFPTLRSLKISFYAYSPLAGGFLVKDKAFLQGGNEGTGGRWDAHISKLYHGMYNKGPLVDALEVWGDISKESGVSKAALAYRWVLYSSQLSASHGDAMIIGSTKVSQLTETLSAIKEGPLDEKTIEKINAWFDLVKNEAPVDNFHG